MIFLVDNGMVRTENVFLNQQRNLIITFESAYQFDNQHCISF